MVAYRSPAATVFATYHAECAGFIRGNIDNLLVAWINLKIDVLGLQREAMTHIKRRQMQMIGLPFLKLQDGTPLPLHTSQINIAARRWCYDIFTGGFILADSIFRRLILQMLGILLGGGFIGLISHVLVSNPVPADHPAEHEHTP